MGMGIGNGKVREEEQIPSLKFKCLFPRLSLYLFLPHQKKCREVYIFSAPKEVCPLDCTSCAFIGRIWEYGGMESWDGKVKQGKAEGSFAVAENNNFLSYSTHSLN
jgi:hypothetical protein